MRIPALQTVPFQKFVSESPGAVQHRNVGRVDSEGKEVRLGDLIIELQSCDAEE